MSVNKKALRNMGALRNKEELRHMGALRNKSALRNKGASSQDLFLSIGHKGGLA